MADKIKKEIEEISTLVVKDFNVDAHQFDLISMDMHEFKKKLEHVIAYLLDKDFERLLAAMYRLDIDEMKFSEVLEGKQGFKVSEAIADLVIERELKKIETRNKYRA